MKNLERQLDESWITNAEAWTQSVREKQIESRRISTDQAVLNEVTSLNPSKVLDVGFGEGWLARALTKQGIEVVGIDGSKELVEKAQSAGGGRFHHLSYLDFSKNPSQLGYNFDVIVCNFSLLSEEITTILQSLSTILSSKGVIIIHTLHPFNGLDQNNHYENGWREESFTGMGEGYKAAMPWFYRTMGSWLNELQSAGLTLHRCKEPIHPITGRPLSLLLTARVLKNIHM